MRPIQLALFVVAMCVTSAHGAIDVPLLIDKPSRVAATHWPVTVGVPMPQGLLRDAAGLAVADDRGQTLPCQIAVTSRWRDGSVRWLMVDFMADLARQYALVTGEAKAGDDDLRIVENESGVTVHAGGAEYRFTRAGGCFDTLTLGGKPIVAGGADAFFVVDSQDRRGILRASSVAVELNGPRRSVVRVEGEYRTADGQRIAAGIVYYHFFAGTPSVRVSHKFIVTEDTNKLWFKDIGLDLPLGFAATDATFNHDHNNPAATTPVKLAAGAAAAMAQVDFPHFGSETSRFVIDAAGKTVAEGGACGDWAGVFGGDSGGASGGAVGLAAQVPAFSETFPKAFVVAGNRLGVRLWAGEQSGQALDFRTESLMKNYFGHDWIPADHAITKVANNAQCTARTHDIWLYPHQSEFDPRNAAATRDAIFAVADPAWIARSQAMGAWHPHDPQRFPGVEDVIEDLFNRGVLAGHKVFPITGYLHWGKYPYSAQPWQLKDGKWYPSIHRLSRSLEYNLKRHVWILTARSAARKYHDYARKYTRFMGDIGFSNWNADAPRNTRGKLYQGHFDSPIVWADRGAYLAYASSEDVIQFVYDYFMTGDCHSRDMVRWWVEAMERDLKYDVDAAIKKFYPSVVFLRILGSAYELEQNQRLYDFGHEILKRTVDPDHEVGLNAEAKQNLGKAGDSFSAFYYYWVSTRDDLALVPLIKRAQFDYRWARFGFGDRSSEMCYAYALAYEKTRNPVLLAYLNEHLRDTAANTQTLKRMGVDFDSLSRRTSTPWGQLTLTASGPVFNGLPVAMGAVVGADVALPDRSLPLVSKPTPTARTYILLRKADDKPARIDAYVNNWGDRAVEPVLRDLAGKVMPLEIVERHEHREFGPPRDEDSWATSPWYYSFETHLSCQLRIPASVPAGVYQLDLGDDVSCTVTYSDIDQFVQVAPDGVVVTRGRSYYFPLPSSVGVVNLFAHRPIHVFDPSGIEVALERVGEGRFRFDAAGRPSGPWQLRTGTDALAQPTGARVDTFVRFENVPLILAQDDPGRLFDFDSSRFASAIPGDLPRPDAAEPFAASRDAGFGKAVALHQRHVKVPVPVASVPDPVAADVGISLDEPGGAPASAAAGGSGPTDFMRRAGTVEFWHRPLWSATDLSMEATDRSTQRGQYFTFSPVRIEYFIDPDNSGRTGRYNIAHLNVQVEGLGNFPVYVFLREGRWYHVAVTWRADGKDSDISVFINGRRRAFHHYRPLPANITPEKLAKPDDAVRIGAGQFYNRGGRGDQFDELRISTVERYTDDFTPPAGPFKPDDKTFLLMHFDGNLSATVNAKPAQGEIVAGSRLK